MPTKTAVLDAARSQLGYNGTGSSGLPSSKYGAWYGINPGHWCAMFLSWCDAQGGGGSFPKFAYCPTGQNWFKSQGRYFGKASEPQVGDIVFFDFGMGRASHVGFVESVSGSSIVTLEGNTTDAGQGRTGNSMRRKQHSRSSANILGYGRPSYAGAAQPAPAQPAPSAPSPAPTAGGWPLPAGHHLGLVTGPDNEHSGDPRYDGAAVREAIKVVQREVKRRGFDPGPIDGLYGSAGGGTHKAVLAWQSANGFVQSGLVGHNDWDQLIGGGGMKGPVGAPTPAAAPTQPAVPTFPGVMRQGEVSDRVGAMQDRLNAHVTFAGNSSFTAALAAGRRTFGPKTVEWVRWFQSARGLDDDGVVGPATWASLWR